MAPHLIPRGVPAAIRRPISRCRLSACTTLALKIFRSLRLRKRRRRWVTDDERRSSVPPLGSFCKLLLSGELGRLSACTTLQRASVNWMAGGGVGGADSWVGAGGGGSGSGGAGS